MRNWLAVGVVFGVLGVASGCSSSSGPATASDFCTQKAQAECQFVAESSSGSGVCEGLTQGACETFRAGLCNTQAEQATSSGLRSYNPGNVAACLSVIGNTYDVLKFGSNTTLAYSGISGPEGDTSTVDYICSQVFPGSVQANATCKASDGDADCANGNVCTPANGGSSTYVCAPPSQVADGAPCGSAGSVCPSGDICGKNTNGEYICEPGGQVLVGEGGKCTTDSDCDPTVAGFCDIYNSTPGTCQPGYSFGGGKDCEAFGATN